eukprot:3645211-Rhodomonas_salina.2
MVAGRPMRLSEITEEMEATMSTKEYEVGFGLFACVSVAFCAKRTSPKRTVRPERKRTRSEVAQSQGDALVT